MESNSLISEKTFLLSILAVISVEVLAIFAAKTGIPMPPGLVATIVIRAVQLLLIILILIRFNGGLSSIGLDREDLLRGVKRGALWSLSFGSLTALVFAVVFLAGKNPFLFFQSGREAEFSEILLYLVAGCFTGPVVEEFFFRGVIYGYFRRWGVLFGIAASTFVFAALHFSVTGIPLIQMTGGLLFAISYEIEKSLMVPLIIHITGNLALYAISLL